MKEFIKFFLIFHVVFAHYYSYFKDEEKFYTFDSQITLAVANQDGTNLMIHVQQKVPFLYRYETNEVTSAYILSFSCLNADTFKISVTDAINSVFQLNESKPYPNVYNLHNPNIDDQSEYFRVEGSIHKLSHCQVQIQYNQHASYLELIITQIRTGVETQFIGFAVEEKFMFFNNYLRTNYLLGLGQRNGKFKIRKGNYTLWAKDNLFAIQRQAACQNTYSYHPIILYRDIVAKAFGIMYFRSSSAIQLQILDQKHMKLLRVELHSNLLELILFSHEDPKILLQKYHSYIGGYSIPPLWAFGFHQSRWGYQNVNQLEEILDGYNTSQYKIESIFLDIDYMKNKKPIQIDEKNFPEKGLRELKDFHSIKIVPIVDFAFNYDFSNKIKGMKEFQGTNGLDDVLNLFLKNPKGEIYIGFVWPGHSIFPDFFHPEIKVFWREYLLYLHKKIAFDAIWLDMNEPANFMHDVNEIDFYNEVNLNCGEHLSNMSIPLSTVHFDGKTEFYLHNLNGIKQQEVTYEIASEQFSEDFFMISRNTFPGSGQFTGHWSGDNLAKQQFLGYSLSSLLNFNLFGVPFTGSDLCGFYGDTTEILCSKWIQANTLFPFFRNHNHIEARDQEFFRLGRKVQKAAKNALQLRYSLIKYIYNLFIQSKGNGVIYKPLFFEFPEDFEKLSEDNCIENQAMVGSDIFFSLAQKVIFPKEISWFVFRDGKLAIQHKQKIRTYLITTPEEQEQKLFVRDGALILEQNVAEVFRIKDLNRNFILRCYLDTQDQCGLTYHNQLAIQSIRKDVSLVQFQSFRIQIKSEGLQHNQIRSIHIRVINIDQESNKKFTFYLDKIIIFTGTPIIQSKGCVRRQIEAGNDLIKTRRCRFQAQIFETRIQITGTMRICSDRWQHLYF